jgi:hypothetical protein
MKTCICAIVIALVAAVGCSDKTTIKTERTVKTPRGEKTVTTEREVTETESSNPRP